MSPHGLLRDVRFALRWLRKSPGFTAVAVLSLGLGVGVNAGMFSVVDALLLRPLPVAEPESLVDVFTSGDDGDVHQTSSYPDLLDLHTRNSVFTDVIGYSPMFAPLSLGARSRLVFGQVVTANHFQVLGIQPALGRLLVPADDEPGAAPVVVLSHRMWVREFASDPGVTSRALTLRGRPYAIAGVAPASFTGVIPLLTPELWLPAAHVEEVEPAGIISAVPGPGQTRLERRGYRWMFVKGRLKPGVTASEARANVQLIGSQLASEYAVTNKTRTMTAVPTRDVRMFVPEAGGPLTAGGTGLMAVVGLVLLIACANLAGLLLARSASRSRELSIRVAIGATRGRLLQQLLVEGVVIGLCGVAVAIGVAWLMVRVLLSIELPLSDFPIDLRLDHRALLFALAAAVFAGLLASISPALKASRQPLVSALRGPASRGASRAGRWGLREWLVSAQVAMMVVLLVIAGLFVRTLQASHASNVGFETRGLAFVSFDTDMVRYSDDRSRLWWQQALEGARSIPGVRHAALASPRVPFELNYSTSGFHVEGRTYSPDHVGEIVLNSAVSPGYFGTLGVPIIRGRDFTEADRAGSVPVVIVSDAMARKFWPDGSAVGRSITLVTTRQRFEIVGVSADYKVRSVGEEPTPYVHFALMQRPAAYNALMIRADGDAESALRTLKGELLAREPNIVFVSQGTMERTFALTLLPARVGSMLAAAFGALGTVLAAIGLYGIVAFAVSRRTREIGIRLALGADRSDVLRMILRQGGRVVLAGAVAGGLVAALAASLLGRVLYGITAADPIAWSSALAVLMAASALAHLAPARRAIRIDPAVTLKDT